MSARDALHNTPAEAHAVTMACHGLAAEPANDNAAPSIEVGRPDLLDLAQAASREMLAKDEAAARRAALEGPPEEKRESWPIVARKLWTGPRGEYWEGQVMGSLPGARGLTVVNAKTCEGLVAMAHRAYLQCLTAGNVCGLAEARKRAADAEFYVSTIV